MINIFLKPCLNGMLDNINGENIIKNLTKLKNKNINLYIEMRSTVNEQHNTPFWNLGSNCLALLLIISTFIPDKDDKVNNINANSEAIVGIFFILIFASLIKVGIKEANKNYYERMLMYFYEIDH